ncbi:MAG: prepilin-type N-terminal cleavage/methylation domain-containing protein [Gammaproteobacteria bacterium]|nr:prepilin-type N-terminal cleavage/methylation domain-containing protein [Gammaproteobacteria bacterium]
MSNQRQTAFTLIEVITTIVILAVAATAIMSVFTSTIKSSANPMIQQQAVSIAEAYMEEILLKSFSDPDGIGGESRSNYDDVFDYDGLNDVGARDQDDNAIASLADYTVTVSVANDALNGIASADAALITVTADHTVLDPIVLQGYRANY